MKIMRQQDIDLTNSVATTHFPSEKCAATLIPVGKCADTVLASRMRTHEIVQSSGKFWRQPTILICDMGTHVTHLTHLLP
jgi:hypothetical protein